MDDTLVGPFDADARCVKCGDDDISARWCSPTGRPAHCRTFMSSQEEHIHRCCRCCGYHWFEGCLDGEE